LVTPQIRGTSGGHRQYGIFCATGPDIKRGQELNGLRIIDVCPTILHLFDIPVVDDMDGRVIKELYVKDSEISLRDVKYQKAEEGNRIENVVKDLIISGKI
jgi:hypothetical protein